MRSPGTRDAPTPLPTAPNPPEATERHHLVRSRPPADVAPPARADWRERRSIARGPAGLGARAGNARRHEERHRAAQAPC